MEGRVQWPPSLRASQVSTFYWSYFIFTSTFQLFKLLLVLLFCFFCWNILKWISDIISHIKMSVFQCISQKDSCFIHTYNNNATITPNKINNSFMCNLFKFLQFQKYLLWLNYSNQDPSKLHILSGICFVLFLSRKSIAVSTASFPSINLVKRPGQFSPKFPTFWIWRIASSSVI